MPKYIFLVAGESNAALIFSKLKTALVSRYGAETRVILSAKDNTGIAEFQKGNPLYNNALAQIKTARDEGYIFSKLFFYQGESDVVSGISDLWEQQFVQFVTNISGDTGSKPSVYFFGLGVRPASYNEENWYRVALSQTKTKADNASFNIIATTGVANSPATTTRHASAGYDTLVTAVTDLLTTDEYRDPEDLVDPEE